MRVLHLRRCTRQTANEGVLLFNPLDCGRHSSTLDEIPLRGGFADSASELINKETQLSDLSKSVCHRQQTQSVWS